MASILIVDDDLYIVDSMTMVLEGNGHKVAVKNDTDNIVDSAKELNPDLIILDVMFPEDPHAGFAAARALEADIKVKDIPVLLLSAVNQIGNFSFEFPDSNISEDLASAENFLEKPVEPAILLAKINELLGG